MKVFKLVMSEKRGKYIFDRVYEKFIKAKNWKSAYKKSIEIGISYFKRFPDSPDPFMDKESIIWFGKNTVIWINSLEEIEII